MSDLPEGNSAPPAATFPDEPFACPHCGQMLAPSVRVCPSCRETIDPNEIPQPEIAIPIAAQVVPLPVKEQAQFSWRVFFLVLGVLWGVSAVSIGFSGIERTALLLGALRVACSLWVLYDARQKGVPKPGRWALGSFLPVVWIFVFSWYLSRRKTPSAPSPFMEGEGGKVFLLVMVVALLAALAFTIMRGPSKHPSGGNQPATNGTSVPGGKIAGVRPSTMGRSLGMADMIWAGGVILNRRGWRGRRPKPCWRRLLR